MNDLLKFIFKLVFVYILFFLPSIYIHEGGHQIALYLQGYNSCVIFARTTVDVQFPRPDLWFSTLSGGLWTFVFFISLFFLATSYAIKGMSLLYAIRDLIYSIGEMLTLSFGIEKAFPIFALGSIVISAVSTYLYLHLRYNKLGEELFSI